MKLLNYFILLSVFLLVSCNNKPPEQNLPDNTALNTPVNTQDSGISKHKKTDEYSKKQSSEPVMLKRSKEGIETTGTAGIKEPDGQLKDQHKI